jgi:hypothetical protein
MCVGFAGATSCAQALEIHQSKATHVPNIKRLHIEERKLNTHTEYSQGVSLWRSQAAKESRSQRLRVE